MSRLPAQPNRVLLGTGPLSLPHRLRDSDTGRPQARQRNSIRPGLRGPRSGSPSLAEALTCLFLPQPAPCPGLEFASGPEEDRITEPWGWKTPWRPGTQPPLSNCWGNRVTSVRG